MEPGKSVAWTWDVKSGQCSLSGEPNAALGIPSGTYVAQMDDFYRLVHPADRERVRNATRDAILSRAPFATEFRFVRDETERWIEATGRFHYSPEGEPERMAGILVDVTEERLAQEERQLSQQRFDRFFATLPEYCYMISPDGDIMEANAAACTALGFTREELVGRHLKSIYAPESIAKAEDLFKRWKDTGEIRNEEMVIVTKHGERLTVLLNAGALKNADGKVIQSTSVQVDITERKRAAEALRLSEERLRLAAEAGRMYAFEWDPATDRVYRSAECASVLGSADEPQWTSAQAFFTKIHPDDRDAFVRFISGLTPGNDRYKTSYRFRRPDGGVIWLEENGHAYFDEQGKMLRLIGMVADITARKQVEERLQASEAFTRQLVKASPVAMLVSEGPEGKVQLVNRKFTQLFGYTTEEMPDVAHWWPLAYPDEVQREAIKAEWQVRFEGAVRNRGEIVPMEAGVRCKDGSIRVIEFHLSNLGDTSLVSFVDVTERNRAANELLELNSAIAHLNRVASMGQMTASLAHELGQPLTAILNNAQAAQDLAGRAEPDLGEIRAALDDIIEDGNRAGSIVQNLRALFRKHTTSPHELDLNQIVNDVGRLVKSDAVLRGVKLQLALSPDPIKIRGDEVPLQQVLVNLVRNGMDAMEQNAPEDRILTVSTSIGKDRRCGVVRIEDSGSGIPGQNKAKLFTPFFTTKLNGLGMGLSICRSIVQSLGGRIGLEDRSGPGAVFQVELPLAAATITTAVPDGTAARMGG